MRVDKRKYKRGVERRDRTPEKVNKGLEVYHNRAFNRGHFPLRRAFTGFIGALMIAVICLTTQGIPRRISAKIHAFLGTSRLNIVFTGTRNA